MGLPSKILLQTTIQTVVDDWSIVRFSMLAGYLGGLRDADGDPVFEIVARDRGPLDQPDPVLAHLDESDFSAMWLFAVDVGDGLSADECAAISRFRARGRGLMVTRDHQDLGSSVCTLGGVGAAHHFHSKNLDPDESRRQIDDPFTTYISWPNYHSGANGDFQTIKIVDAIYPVLTDAASQSGAISFLAAHPHEGAVGKPADDSTARVIATGISKVSGAPFNLAVAFEPSTDGGPAVAQSTFHHFADYNWDPAAGAPSFVSETPGDALAHSPAAQRDIRLYTRNLALWLVGRAVNEPITDPALDDLHREAVLDEELEESFPASDPPAATRRGG
ncbi:hypothetical protein BH10PSE3_BH10PSE3_09670 [soil metagenome]